MIFNISFFEESEYMKIHNKELKKKAIEKKVTKIYFENVYNFSPQFIDIEFDIPDCYFEYKEKKYAVEVTRYFAQNSIKENVEYSNAINNFIDSENLIKDCYNRLGKRKVKNNLIIFNNIDDLNMSILAGTKYIKSICIKNKLLYNRENTSNSELNESFELTEIIKFLNDTQSDIKNNYNVNIILKKKNKNIVHITFRYSKILSLGNSRTILPVFSYLENIDEIHNNILESIDKKIKKFFKEYRNKMSKNSLHYDCYILIVYYEFAPAEINSEEFYSLFLEKINNIGYDEIAIFISGGILIINNNKKFKLYKYP